MAISLCCAIVGLKSHKPIKYQLLEGIMVKASCPVVNYGACDHGVTSNYRTKSACLKAVFRRIIVVEEGKPESS